MYICNIISYSNYTSIFKSTMPYSIRPDTYIDQRNTTQSPQVKLHIYGQFIFNKAAIQDNSVGKKYCFQQAVLGQLDKHIEQDSERAMAPHSSTLAWKIPWRSPVGCSPWGDTELDTTERLHFHFSLSCIGEGNGNPLQCSCLENPRDGEAWWAAVYGVAQSRTRLN